MTKRITPYDIERQFNIPRIDTISGKEIVMESEVNFFVKAIEKAGGKVLFTCGGHPTGFQIVFDGEYKMAIDILNCGYFTIEMTRQLNQWNLRLSGNESGIIYDKGDFTEADRDRLLSRASENWVKNGFIS